MDNLFDFLITLGYIIAHGLYLFATAFVGQQMVNHADELFNAV